MGKPNIEGPCDLGFTSVDHTRALAAVIAVLAVGGCGSSSPAPSASGNTVVIEQQLAMASAAGAAPEQIEQLEVARDQGEVKIEQIVDLNTRVEDCLTTAGFTVRDTGMEEILAGSGIEMPGYVATQPADMDDAAAGKVMDSCGHRYLEFLQSAYMSQPSTDAQYYAAFDMPAIRQCLADHGVDVDDDATGREIANLASDDQEKNMALSDFRPCLPGVE